MPFHVLHAIGLSVGLATATAASLPNIVYFMTDDQDVEMGGMTPMPKIRKLLGDEGAVGENFYTQTPVCCPSRTEMLSGRMYHNVLSDDLSGCMHVDRQYIFNHSSSIYPALQKAGYLTAAFGKIINGQQHFFKVNHSALTNGFDWISAPLSEDNYFESEYFNKRPNGSTWMESLGDPIKDKVDSWYQTSQMGNRSLAFIEHAVAAGKPFAAYIGPHAPHFSADPAPWTRELYNDLQAPRTPAWNTSVGQGDKTKHVAVLPPIDAEAEKWIDIHFRDRWRSITGVDDMVALVIDGLVKLNVLDNTYVFFSSDHGLKLGHWRLGCHKTHPYETDVHIPFFARGPGIAPGTRVTALGSQIDIGPTFLDIAGLPVNPEHDGKSLLPMLTSTQGTQARLQQEAGWRTTQLIEYLSVDTLFNSLAPLWVSGPAATPGTPTVYGKGPKSSSANGSACASEVEATTGTGEGTCYHVDSLESNNWVGIRVRNSTHNLMYVESFGRQAVHTKVPGAGTGLFKCLKGDLCQWELYDYGEITSDYPNYPVFTEARWNIHNIYAKQTAEVKAALAAQLKHEYCSTRKLTPDRMECGGD